MICHSMTVTGIFDISIDEIEHDVARGVVAVDKIGGSG